MTPALTWLTLTLFLALAYIFAPAAARTLKFGANWNAGARDKDMGDPGVLAGRLLRAQANLYETLPLMVGAVLIAHVANADAGQAALHGLQGALVALHGLQGALVALQVGVHWSPRGPSQDAATLPHLR